MALKPQAKMILAIRVCFLSLVFHSLQEYFDLHLILVQHISLINLIGNKQEDEE